MEEQHMDSPSILGTNYVRISELSKPDTRSPEDMAQTPNLESCGGPEKIGNIPEPVPPSSEASLPLGLRSGQDSDLNLPTHPDIINLSHIRQEPQEKVR